MHKGCRLQTLSVASPKLFFLNRAPTSVQTRVVMCSERLDAPRTSLQCKSANSDLANETNRSRLGEGGVLTFSSCIKEGRGRGKGDREKGNKEEGEGRKGEEKREGGENLFSGLWTLRAQ